MSHIRSKNMVPEMVVRKLLYSLGYRYRLHARDLPGKPDIVFRRKRKVVLVHGCFWHQHDDASCKIVRTPKSRQGYWIPKLQRNVKRDSEVICELQEAGWKVLVVWECELQDIEKLTSRLVGFIG